MSYVEESIQCPYHKHHIILKSRFITHLCKCRKQHGGNDFSTCPFNTAHSVLTPELKYHTTVCPDRKNLDSHLYVVADENAEQTFKHPNIELQKSESWDDEPETHSSYLDLKENVIAGKQILRLPAGKSKAQRKQFFENEVQRFEMLSKGEQCGDTTKQIFSSFETGVNQNGPPAVKCLGRGIKHNTKNKETYKNETAVIEDDEFYSSFAIVLKSRGRGRGMSSTS